MVVKIIPTLRKKVYRANPHTIEEMKENIQRETVSISQEELQHANTEFL
jgi:hypothetical protein